MESIVLLILGLLAMIVVILLAQIFVWAGDYLEKRQERKVRRYKIHQESRRWPLWYGSFDVKVCKNIAAQLAYHFCKLDCDDPEVIKAQNALIPLANQFNFAYIFGKLKPKETNKNSRLPDDTGKAAIMKRKNCTVIVHRRAGKNK